MPDRYRNPRSLFLSLQAPREPLAVQPNSRQARP
jgi:hypothetical protein